MQRFNLIALKAALPPNTQVIVTGGILNVNELRIGNPPMLEIQNDTSSWGEMTSTTRLKAIDAGGRLETDANGGLATEDVQVARWPSSVHSAEEMVAFTYWTTLLQQTLGADAYLAAESAAALPVWSAGATLKP